MTKKVPSPIMDYRCHLLRTSEQFDEFRSRYGKILPTAMENTRAFLSRLPNDAWIEYLKGVPTKNIPVVIGCICLYTLEYDCARESIDFNRNATMIRYRRYEWKNLNDIKDYAKYREEMQNNGSTKQ